MTEKQEIFTSEFLEVFGKLKELAEKIIPDVQAEVPQQDIETAYASVDTSTPTEETTEQSSEDTVENLEIKAIAANMIEILSLIKISNRKDKIIDNLHKELMQYIDDLKEFLVVPLLKTIVREYDRANKQYRFYLEKSQTEPQSELFNKLLSEFEIISFSLLNMLSDYDIEPFLFNAGEARDSKLQKIIEVIETEDPEQDGTVAVCVACGFRNIDTARLFRQAEVKIYKQKIT
jgi:molecular chaperone GrpE (heat shock protein)